MIPEGPRGLGSGGYLLWPLFDTSNQLLAAISLLIVTIWLKQKGRSIIYTLVPLIFVLFMTLWAMVDQVFSTGQDSEGRMEMHCYFSLALLFWFSLFGLSSREFSLRVNFQPIPKIKYVR